MRARPLPSGRAKRFSPLLATLVLGATACAEYAPAEQDLALSYDAASDVLTVTFDTRGIHAQSPRVLEPFSKGPTEEERIERAVKALRRAGDGSPYFAPLGSPYALDLSEALEEAEDEIAAIEDPTERAFAERAAAFVRALEVADAGLYLDEEGEVALLQRVRLPRAQALVALVNDAITAEVLEDRGATDEVDPQKRAMRSYAQSGEAWVVLDAEALEVRVPMEPREAAEFVRGLAGLAFEDASEDAEPWERVAWAATGRALFEGLDTLSMENGVARLRYPFGDDGRIVFPFRGMRAPGEAGRLREALAAARAEAGEEPLEALGPDEVAARLAPRPAVDAGPDVDTPPEENSGGGR